MDVFIYIYIYVFIYMYMLYIYTVCFIPGLSLHLGHCKTSRFETVVGVCYNTVSGCPNYFDQFFTSGLLICHDMLPGVLLAEHHISEGEAYFQLLVFIMPLPQRSLRLSLLQATALLALGIPPIVTLGWNSGVVLTKPLLQWYKYITTKKSRNSSAAGEQTFIWRFLRNWCVIISLELYGV